MSGALRLRHRVLEAVRAHEMWGDGQRVVVSCSGGRDSMVLLDVLWATRRAHGGRVEALTIDHGVRAESASDADFVVAYWEERGVTVDRVRVRPTSSSEADLRAARQVHYDAIVAEGGVVALGHHRRDQAETLLLHLIRGGGVRARAGMRAVARGRVRPLLDEGVDALGAWADQRGLPWRDDATNLDPRYLRNRVRREILPVLEAIRPGAEMALARSARLAAADDAALEAAAADLPLEPGLLAAAPEALGRRALRRRWPEATAGAVDALWGAVRKGRGEVAVGGGRHVLVSEEGLHERVGDADGVVTTSEPARSGLEESS